MNAKMSGLDALGSVEHIATFHALPRRPAFGSRRPILTRALFSKKQKQAAPSKLKDTPCVSSFLYLAAVPKKPVTFPMDHQSTLLIEFYTSIFLYSEI